MRRLSRRRRAGSAKDRRGRAAPIDAARWFERLRVEGNLGISVLEATPCAAIPPALAAVGRGERAEGSAVALAFAPREAGDALLAALCLGAQLAEEENFAGEVIAVAPSWTVASRRRLGLVRAELPFHLNALAAPALLETSEGVEPEAGVEPAMLTLSQLIGQVAKVDERALFERAVRALEGLAAKHGGGVRAVGRTLEVALMARRVAVLRMDEEQGITLETLQPQRSTQQLTSDALGSALDALEGQLRKTLNDRRLRDAEEGIRTRAIPLLVRALTLRASAVWPVGGVEHDSIDLLGVDPDGNPVVAAVRSRLGLTELGSVLDGLQAVRSALPALLEGARAPLRLSGPPRLALAARELEPGVARVLAGLSLSHIIFELEQDRQLGLCLREQGSEAATRSIRERAARGRRRARADRGRTGDSVAPEEVEPAEGGAAAEEDSEKDAPDDRSWRRGRRRSRRGKPNVRDDSPASEGVPYEEVSLFDLDREAGGDADEETGEVVASAGRSRARRGRGRRGRRSRPAADVEPESQRVEESSPDATADGEAISRPRRGRQRRGRSREVEASKALGVDEEDEADEELDEELEEIADDLFPLDETIEAEPEPDEPSAASLEEADGPGDRAGAEVAEARTRPRRRAVLVACSDRDSLISAVVLARDLRLIEGVWTYPQSELMNFFRGVATDLAEDVPIHMIGFSPSPARDVIQAASLYRGRLDWYDHHSWPPEDRLRLCEALGEGFVHHVAAVGSSLPMLLETCVRRSRFTDKLVDLAVGRFSEHDYERWGRLWWWRLGKLAGKTGDVRGEISALLSGRPSELAREAAEIEEPPLPPEVDFVSQRDFRLIHFAGYAMVVLDVRPDLDAPLAARMARDRYEATVSLAHHEGSGLFLFGGEETSGRRGLDFGALAEHLATKLQWVEALPDDDHIARIEIREFERHPERLDEVIDEIAMARSVLER